MRILVTGGSGFIGTHFIDLLRRARPDAAICNVDLRAPKLESHRCYWTKCDILDGSQLDSVVLQFGPTHVVHMAARTDTDSNNIADYRVNTEGSANLIASMKPCSTIERTIFVSTQYVVGPGKLPDSVRDHRPHTTYGRSKCIMEDLIFKSDIAATWTIVRPTNVWGSWHPRYAEEFWLIVKKGKYVHPGGAPVYRGYAYVGNVVEQIWAIFHKETASVDRRVIYVGDEVADIRVWVAAFSRALTGKEPRVVPRSILRLVALVGDVVKMTGRPFPLFTSRYRSMTGEYRVDMKPTFQLLGPPRYSLDEGVRQTVDWLRTQGELWRQ